MAVEQLSQDPWRDWSFTGRRLIGENLPRLDRRSPRRRQRLRGRNPSASASSALAKQTSAMVVAYDESPGRW